MALAAALMPALVFRGAIVTVDVFATFFVLAALVALGGVAKPEQFVRIVVAGACCGLAAVSKYPTGLVLLAAIAVALERPGWSWRERLRAIALAGGGAVVAAMAGMPSLWSSPQGVWQRILWQRGIYQGLPVGSYWRQAFERVEWDLPQLPYPEIGIVLSIVALAGMVWLVVHRPSRGTALGLVLFSAALVALYSRYPFQAFRNLLPVAAVACVAAGAVVGAAGERLGRPRLAALLGTALLLVLLGSSARDYVLNRTHLIDTRHAALDWIAANAAPRASVLVMAEAAVARAVWSRLQQPIKVRMWKEARRMLRQERPRFSSPPASKTAPP